MPTDETPALFWRKTDAGNLRADAMIGPARREYIVFATESGNWSWTCHERACEGQGTIWAGGVHATARGAKYAAERHWKKATEGAVK